MTIVALIVGTAKATENFSYHKKCGFCHSEAILKQTASFLTRKLLTKMYLVQHCILSAEHQAMRTTRAREIFVNTGFLDNCMQLL